MNTSIRHVSVARRQLATGIGPSSSKSKEWEKFVLRDYNQSEDDGHNVWVRSIFALVSLINVFHYEMKNFTGHIKRGRYPAYRL